jgi:hypothetical protein
MDGIRRVMTVGRRFQPNRLSDQSLSQAYQPLVPIVSQRVSQTHHSSGSSLRAHMYEDQRMPRRAAGGHR